MPVTCIRILASHCPAFPRCIAADQMMMHMRVLVLCLNVLENVTFTNSESLTELFDHQAGDLIHALLRWLDHVNTYVDGFF